MEVGGWAASPLVEKLLNEGFARLGINAEKKLQKLRVTVLPLLKSVIEKAEGSAHRSEVEDWLQRLEGSAHRSEVEYWLQRLKDAYYDAEDTLDLLNYHYLKSKAAEARRRTNRVRFPFRVPKPPKWIGLVLKGGRDMLLSRQKIKLKRSLNKLVKIAGEAEKLCTLFGVQPDQTVPPYSRQTISLPPLKVFGRDEDRDEIIRRLKMESAAATGDPGSTGIPVIAIVGRPGVGKTTLAQHVCQKLRAEELSNKYFDLVMWVFASCNFNVFGIMKSILQQASDPSETLLNVSMFGSLEVLQKEMDKKLNAKKFLLVIDDVWYDEEDHKINWDTLFRCLSKCCSPEGSKILVTSQTDDAPRKIVTSKGATVEYVYDLKELEENDFLDLFIHHALPSEEMDSSLRKDLEEKCKTIGKKLNKDPTAAKIVGFTIALELDDLLCSRGNCHTYLRMIEQKDWSGHKTKALMWSYRHLPAHLQRCFSYCSLYPRGYKFQALELVQLWMAQGFIKPDDQDKRMEDVGNDYLEMLVSRFYIQRHNRVHSSFGTGRLVSYYMLHELFHDLAEKVSRNDCVGIEANHQSQIPSTICHLRIPAYKLNEKKEEICKLKKLRTLIITRGESNTEEENVATDIFKSLKKLRVLVSELYLENLAEFISEMKHLHILQVSGTSEFVLPESVCSLYQLQVLRIKSTRLLTIENAPSLTFITNEDLQMSLTEKRSIIEVMKKRMQKWFLLQHHMSFVSNEKKMMNFIAAMNDSNNEASFAEHNKSVPATDLDITAVWERWWQRHERKMELIYNRQNEVKLLLPSTLTGLRLEGCNITNHALSACLQTVPSLTCLQLEEIRTVTCLPSADVLGKLKALQTLSLQECWALTSLGGIGSVPHLKELYLSGCPCLHSETAFLPSSSEIITFESCADVDVILANADLPCLSDLTIIECHMRATSLQFGNLRSLHSLAIVDCIGLSFLVDLQKLHSLEFLVLLNCSNLEAVMNLPRSLKHLEILRCPILEERSVNVDPLS